MAEPSLDRPRVVALVGQGVAAGVPQHVGVRLELQLAPSAARSIIRAKPAVVNGEPRSLTKTKGESGSRAGAGAGLAARRPGSGACSGCRS